jgi:hypothetical protein
VSLAAARPHVLVQAEDVVRVVSVLEGDETLVLLGAVGDADPLVARKVPACGPVAKAALLLREQRLDQLHNWWETIHGGTVAISTLLSVTTDGDGLHRHGGSVPSFRNEFLARNEGTARQARSGRRETTGRAGGSRRTARAIPPILSRLRSRLATLLSTTRFGSDLSHRSSSGPKVPGHVRVVFRCVGLALGSLPHDGSQRRVVASTGWISVATPTAALDRRGRGFGRP